MSFFGVDTSNDTLEKEKELFLRGALGGREEVAVYNWGESDYDGLGDALQEKGDELNDETFNVGPVGKDFDFSNASLQLGQEGELPRAFELGSESKAAPRREYQDALLHGKTGRPVLPVKSLESLWNDKSPMLGVTGARASTHSTADLTTPVTSGSIQKTTTFESQYVESDSQPPIRTLQEIEAELKQTGSQPPRNQMPFVSQVPINHIYPGRSPEISDNSYMQHQKSHSSPQLTAEEVEHQLRMLHLSQLHQHQAQRHELQQQQQMQMQIQRQELQRLERERRELQLRELQRQEQQQLQLLQLQQQQALQQQAIYQNVPHLRQQHLRTPDQLIRQSYQRSFPNTPEPRLPTPMTVPAAQAYQTQQQQQSQMIQHHLLASLSQAGVGPDQIHMLDPMQREAIMNEARRKILAAEKLDQKNRRRLAKMERMARYNDLMTQSDKDFITRIQVSQLVTADPYTEDFYAQVLNSLRRSAPGARHGQSHRMSGRREHAMNRMAEQVYRIVENAKAREKEKGQNGVNPLQGVLGKTAGRSYKAAPRQLLQVDSAPTTESRPSSPQLDDADLIKLTAVQAEGGQPFTEKTATRPSTTPESKEPLTHRQVLAIIESLFDYALEWENNRRLIPETGTDAFENWRAGQRSLEAKMWEASQVTAPLDGRYPHPLVSILQPLKGKKVMKRLTRIMDARQLRITMTLITRLFPDFDVVQNYTLVESLEDTKEKHELERHLHAFEESVLEAVLPALAVAPLPFVSGQLELLRDPVKIALTTPGVILLTHIFNRAAVINDRTLTVQSGGNFEGINQDDLATAEDFEEWQTQFDELFEILAPHFVSFFPSTRVLASLPFGLEHQFQTSLALDVADQPVWHFFASMAVPASSQQQAVLVTQLRDKVLENILSVKKGWIKDEAERDLKLRNVNIFLHALGLDSSQVNL